MRRPPRLLLAACLLCALPQALLPYSVFTHEQIIDLAWKRTLEPLLKERYPHTSSEELRRAHSFAYGGCAIQDLGYYPFANEFFSNLTHYVRTGEFVMNLLRDARDVNEYAFALGALSHYVGDNIGHHDAINPATAIGFPKLAKKFGPSVTYDENPHAHIRTEFAFDIDQLSHQRLAPGAYLRFIGLRVPVRLLSEAFEQSYSLPLRNLLRAGRPAVRSYRWSVRTFLPRVAYAESVLHKKQFPQDISDEALQKYLATIAREEFQKVWSRYRKHPGFKTHVIAVLIRITPKIGVLSDLAIKIPTPHTENLYVKSVNNSVDLYGSLLQQLGKGPSPSIPDRDLDTGERSKPCAYALTDRTYADLLHRVVNDGQNKVGPGLKQDILDYYSDPQAPIVTKRHKRAWAKVQSDLAALRAMPDGS